MDEIVPETSNGRAPEDVRIVDINNRLDKQFRDLTNLLPALTDLDTSKERPSIYWTGSYPERFCIGVLLQKDSGNQADKYNMWEHVAFMTRWLGLDVNSYLVYMKDKECLVRSYYDEDYFVFREGKDLMESLLVAGCSLAFAILLLQKIRNGTEILKGTSDYNNDPVDQRSLQFSILYQRIMKDRIKTKIDMLRLRNQIPWVVVEAVSTYSNLSGFSSPLTRSKRRKLNLISITEKRRWRAHIQ